MFSDFQRILKIGSLQKNNKIYFGPKNSNPVATLEVHKSESGVDTN